MVLVLSVGYLQGDETSLEMEHAPFSNPSRKNQSLLYCSMLNVLNRDDLRCLFSESSRIQPNPRQRQRKWLPYLSRPARFNQAKTFEDRSKDKTQPARTCSRQSDVIDVLLCMHIQLPCGVPTGDVEGGLRIRKSIKVERGGNGRRAGAERTSIAAHHNDKMSRNLKIT